VTSARAEAGPATVRELLPVAAGWLGEQGVDEARLATEHLLAHVLGVRRLDLYLDHDRPLVPAERERFRALMRRRAAREPLAYITGERGFYGLDLAVGPGVLVPRPETEHLVEAGLEALDAALAAGAEAPVFADVGAGSGCVALALLHERPAARGLALDVSAAALAVARRNAERLGLAERLAVVRADLLGACAAESLDLVLSNPPYVTPDERHLLAPEIADHEPVEALYDEAGLPLTRRLAADAARALRPGGVLALETGWRKGDLVRGLLADAGFADVRTVPDYGGHERVVVGRRAA